MGKTFAAPGNYSTSLEMPAQIEQFRYSHEFVQEVSTSAACFFTAAAGEPPRLGLAKPFWGLAKAFWVASLIVHPEL